MNLTHAVMIVVADQVAGWAEDTTPTPREAIDHVRHILTPQSLILSGDESDDAYLAVLKATDEELAATLPGDKPANEQNTGRSGVTMHADHIYDQLATVAGQLDPEHRDMLARVLGDMVTTPAPDGSLTKSAQIGTRQWLDSSGYTPGRWQYPQDHGPICPECDHPVKRHTTRVGDMARVCAHCQCIHYAIAD